MSLFHDSAIVGASGQAGAAGYQISRSLRFNSSDSAFCSRVFPSAGNRKKWTLSLWVKRSGLGQDSRIFSAATSGSNQAGITFNTDNTIEIFDYQGSYGYRKVTAQVFRDTSAWYHLLLAADFDNATAEDRLQFYVNGSRVTAFSTNTNPSSGYSTGLINSAVQHGLGAYTGPAALLNGYLADVIFIDAQQLTPSSLVEVSATTGRLEPKAYSGPTPTGNSFWLPFSDNSAATATTLGKDGFLLGNNWTPNNLSVTPVNGYQITGFDITNGGGAFANSTLPASGNGTNAYHFPKANGTYTLSRTLTATTKIEAYCYIDSISGPTIQANGGSAITVPAGSSYAWSKVNLGVTSLSSITLNAASWSLRDFWLSCFIVDDVVVYGTPALAAGNDSLVDTPTSGSQVDTGLGGQVTGNYCTWNPLRSTGALSNGSLDSSCTASTHVVTGTFAVSSGKWYWEITPTSSNYNMLGILSSTVTIGGTYPLETAGGYGYYQLNGNRYPGNNTYGAAYSSGDVIGFALNMDAGTLVCYKNGVSQGTFISGLTGSWSPAASQGSPGTYTCTANFGQRPFAYTAPSGFKALCDTNLPAPVVAKPNTVMDVALWTGDTSTTRSITGLNFSPDLVWIKNRGSAYWNVFFDAVRGAGNQLSSNQTDAELASASNVAGKVSSFDANGFTLASGSSGIYTVNENAKGHVGWCWDAGSTTVTNTQGSITSSVRANPSAGFSVVTWSGTNNDGTIGHGLGAQPALIIAKNRTSANEWCVLHSKGYNGSWGAGYLRQTAAFVDITGNFTGSNFYDRTAPTSSVFSVSGNKYAASDSGSISGQNYVVYAFAPVTGYSSAFTYTGNGSSDGPMVWLGFRPRWIMYKVYSGDTGHWFIHDTSRDPYNEAKYYLRANLSDAETTSVFYPLDILSNGFKIRSGNVNINGSGLGFIGFAFAESPFAYSRAR